MTRLLAAGLAIGLCGLGACGGDPSKGVEVTEAPASSERVPADPRSARFDSVYADSGLFADPRLDSLGQDSLGGDRLARDPTPRPTAAPDFRTAWPAFVAAVRRDRAAVRAQSVFSDAFPEADFPALYDAAVGDGPFRDGVLALTARDFRRDGTARQAVVTVGYDADGQIVPEDEAETESAVVLRFDVVDGAYRLVQIALAG